MYLIYLLKNLFPIDIIIIINEYIGNKKKLLLKDLKNLNFYSKQIYGNLIYNTSFWSVTNNNLNIQTIFCNRCGKYFPLFRYISSITCNC